MSRGREKEFGDVKAAPKGKTNMVKLRNNFSKASGRPVMRAKSAQRSDGAHVSKMVPSSPGRTAMYDGDNPGVRILALGNPTGNPPVQPALVPVNADGKEWLKEVQAEAQRIAEELAEQ